MVLYLCFQAQRRVNHHIEEYTITFHTTAPLIPLDLLQAWAAQWKNKAVGSIFSIDIWDNLVDLTTSDSCI